MRRLLAGNFVDVPQHGATVRADHRRGGAGVAIIFPVEVFDGAVIGEGASDGAERLAGAFQRPGAAAVGEDAEVADAVQPFRQDVKEEAPDELVDGDGGGAVTWLALPRFPGLLFGRAVTLGGFGKNTYRRSIRIRSICSSI